MDSFARNFVLSALFYLGAMALIGLGSALENPWAVSLRYSHIHLGLLGWMSMMIFGVGYHVIPRFAGRPIFSRRLGHLHWWLANLGLVGMAVFFRLKTNDPSWRIPFQVAALVQTVSIFCFIINITASLAGGSRPAVLSPVQPQPCDEPMKLKRRA